jgi:chromosome segregation ATPase
VSTTPETEGQAQANEAAARQLEVWALRDAVVGAEAAAGQLRARVRALESELDDRRRHAEALLVEVAALRERIEALERVEAHRDAMLRSLTWRVGVIVMRPVQAVRRHRPA